ncbi:hypothetical protein B7P43_G12875 [Cryptotermes secundus]|uniref:Uncharacterized protein n=1 Tax=Cryptotermes secundus TaxID=105785 RepID=A0A2J7QP90_9NEOP|nr:hypothetical protein B7P43_G12875 [Cryptotermes secundus]
MSQTRPCVGRHAHACVMKLIRARLPSQTRRVGLASQTQSWVELSAQPTSSHTPDRVTPLPFSSGEEYLRLLREAQRESNQSSARVSVASSRRDTPRDSPKSPPNSPNTELSTDDDLKGVYINYCYKMRWSGNIARLGEKRNAYSILEGKPEGKRPLGRPRRRWVDSVKMDITEIGLDGMDGSDLAQDREQWRTLVNMAMNLRGA